MSQLRDVQVPSRCGQYLRARLLPTCHANGGADIFLDHSHRVAGVAKPNRTVSYASSRTLALELCGGSVSQEGVHPPRVVVELDVLECVLARLLPVPQRLPFTSSCFNVPKNDSATALSWGLPGLDTGCVIPCPLRHRWQTAGVYRMPWPLWNVSPPSGLSMPTAWFICPPRGRQTPAR